jgi:ribonuclease P protein subunit RPR2
VNPAQEECLDPPTADLQAALRLARAVAAGEVRAFLVAEAEAIPGVRSATLIEAGPIELDERGAAAMLALPIGDTDVLVALLDWSADEELERRLSEVAALAEPLLVNERRLSLSRLEARRDPLTGLRNRRALAEHLAKRGNRPVTVVFCDLDGFKRVNDELGYHAGDEALQEVGRIISSELRPGEEVFRVGGDEFCVVLEQGEEVAAKVGERLAAAVRGRTRAPELPGLSVGIAAAHADVGADGLIERASAALAEGRRARPREPLRGSLPRTALSVLVVDDDPGLRTLLRVTFEIAELEVTEAATAAEARAAIARRPPDAIVLDVELPDLDGLTLTKELRAESATAKIGIVLLTGGETEAAAARAAGADALVQKPFSPLELLEKVRRVAGAATGSRALAAIRAAHGDDQLLLYAGDLRRLLDVERRQRHALGRAYRETLGALANALETRDTGTAAHSIRVQRYASEIARAVEPGLLDDPSLEYGFLLHDIGKIGIPDQVLRKPGKLSPGEWRLMQMHAPIGAGILAEVGLLAGEGLGVVRHHHERWDGAGYPDGLAGEAIPLAARIFAVADALDAITSDRPYRKAQPWSTAVEEIAAQRGRQFDPQIVDAFREREPMLLRLHENVAA